MHRKKLFACLIKCRSSMTIKASVYPLGEVVTCLQRSLNLRRVHVFVLGHILRILPLKELHAILSVRLTSKVAIGSSLLVLWFTKRQGNSNGAWTTIELHFDYICDIHWVQGANLCPVCLHK